jgi:hypothetical protein
MKNNNGKTPRQNDSSDESSQDDMQPNRNFDVSNINNNPNQDSFYNKDSNQSKTRSLSKRNRREQQQQEDYLNSVQQANAIEYEDSDDDSITSNRQRQNNNNVSVFLNPGDKQNSISQKFQKDDELMNNSTDAQIIKDLIASVRKLFLHYKLKDYEAYPDIYDFVSVIIDNDTIPEKKNLEKFKSKIDIELLKTIIHDTSLQNTDVILTVKNLLGLLEKNDCKTFMDAYKFSVENVEKKIDTVLYGKKKMVNILRPSANSEKSNYFFVIFILLVYVTNISDESLEDVIVRGHIINIAGRYNLNINENAVHTIKGFLSRDASKFPVYCESNQNIFTVEYKDDIFQYCYTNARNETVNPSVGIDGEKYSVRFFGLSDIEDLMKLTKDDMEDYDYVHSSFDKNFQFRYKNGEWGWFKGNAKPKYGDCEFDYKNGKWGWYDNKTHKLRHETIFDEKGNEIIFEKVIPYPPLYPNDNKEIIELSFSQYKLLILIMINIQGKLSFFYRRPLHNIDKILHLLKQMVVQENFDSKKLKLPPWGYNIIAYLQNFFPVYNKIEPELHYNDS